MKHIHFPTLALHGLNLILAYMLIHDYSGAFLFFGISILLIHMVWCCISPKLLTLSHLLGCALEAVFFSVFEIDSGAFGLGGGEFALLFYLIALGGSAVIELMVALYRYFK